MRQELVSADMRTLTGKLTALRAVANMMGVLCAMSRDLPTITWGIGQQVTRTRDGTEIAKITNMGGECADLSGLIAAV